MLQVPRRRSLVTNETRGRDVSVVAKIAQDAAYLVDCANLKESARALRVCVEAARAPPAGARRPRTPREAAPIELGQV